MKYEVIVGNIGIVCRTDHEDVARADYDTYVSHSKAHYGRGADEQVTLTEDGEPIEEHIPEHKVYDTQAEADKVECRWNGKKVRDNHEWYMRGVDEMICAQCGIRAKDSDSANV